jgi:biopolymer transport protein ExbD
MADIFMILLVFLLKNYSASLTSITPSSVMALPEQTTNAKTTIKDTLKVEISSDFVMVDQKSVAKLNNFEFSPDEDGDFGTSTSVAQALKDQRTLTPNPNNDSTLIVMADEKVPYATIKRVIASAAQAGFVDLQLVVMEPD